MKKIAFVTDIHIDEAFPIKQGVNARKNWQRILADIQSRNIEHIIFGGDIGEQASNEWFFNTLRHYHLYLILGNHDTYAEAQKYYSNEYLNSTSELYYSFIDEDFKWLFLDSSSGTISQLQFDWLLEELQTDLKILIFIHHPILPVETAVDITYPLKGREKISRVLQSCNAEVNIFCGHYHMEDAQFLNNIKQCITPAGSYQMIKNKDEVEIDNSSFGYGLLEIHDGKVESNVIEFTSDFLSDD